MSLISCDNLTVSSLNGVSYAIYVPENVNPNTEVFVFVHGGAEMTAENIHNDWNSVIQYQLKEHGSNSIIIMPTMSDRWDPDWGSKTMDLVEAIKDQYGIENNSVTSSGFSYGGWGAYQTTIENIKRNPDLEPQVLFLLDDYGLSTQNPEKYVLSNGGKEALLENESILFSYHSQAPVQEWGDKARSNEEYAKSGLNMIRVICDKGGHQEIKDNFFKAAMVGYTAGITSLPSVGYTYQVSKLVTDPTTGEQVVKWETVDVKDIQKIDGLYNYFGISGYTSKLNTLSLSNGISSENTVVDITALQDWSSKMTMINEDSIDILNSLIATIKDLNSYWVGNIANGFIEDSSALVQNIQKCHDDMKGVASFLIEVVNTMREQ